MHANKPGTQTQYHDVIGRPRGDVPKNPEAVVRARKMLTDSLPKIEMNEADAAEGGCGVVGLASEVPIAGRHLFRSLEQMRNRGNGKGGGVAMVGLTLRNLQPHRMFLRAPTSSLLLGLTMASVRKWNQNTSIQCLMSYTPSTCQFLKIGRLCLHSKCVRLM